MENPTNNAEDDGNQTQTMMMAAMAVVERKKKGPPANDVCPICFGDFTFPCRSECLHWFCGRCILEYWNYSSSIRPCKCPMCSSLIKSLTAEASLLQRQEPEVTEILENIRNYNNLYAGGLRGYFLRIRCQLFAKRLLLAMMDPRRCYLSQVRLFALLLAMIYMFLPFEFLPKGRVYGVTILTIFDNIAFLFVMTLQLIGSIRRYQLRRRVRALAAANN